MYPGCSGKLLIRLWAKHALGSARVSFYRLRRAFHLSVRDGSPPLWRWHLRPASIPQGRQWQHPANDHIFMTFQCVGYHAARSRTGEFALDSNHPVDKTLVLMSNTGGATWKSLGYVNQAKWRMGVVPLGDELGFGVDNALLLGNLGPNGKYVFDTEANPASNEPWTWEPDFSANKNVPLDRIYANMWAHPILTRTPDAKSYLLAFPDVIGKSSGFGYRLYWYDRGMQLLTAKDSVMSANPSPDNVIFHLTAVDPGKGPVLFYWYDLDSAAKQGTIRGRLIDDR